MTTYTAEEIAGYLRRLPEWGVPKLGDKTRLVAQDEPFFAIYWQGDFKMQRSSDESALILTGWLVEKMVERGYFLWFKTFNKEPLYHCQPKVGLSFSGPSMLDALVAAAEKIGDKA